MKAPDKIYIEQKAVMYDLVNIEPCKPDDYEYISKDALIERLEKVAASYKKRSDEGELVWQNMCGINEAINIINKM